MSIDYPKKGDEIDGCGSIGTISGRVVAEEVVQVIALEEIVVKKEAILLWSKEYQIWFKKIEHRFPSSRKF